MLSELDRNGHLIFSGIDTEKRAALGQFLTPANIARFMVGLFHEQDWPACRLLDPGAGVGTLSAAFEERWHGGHIGCPNLAITAVEIERAFLGELQHNLEELSRHPGVTAHLVAEDFIEEAVNLLCQDHRNEFTHAILNPPYKKIGSRSWHRLLLRRIGIETVNLYSAFVALALELLAPKGQLVAIIPRSFCNGPYYRPFREFLLSRASILHIHLFGARDRAFKKDKVLQENVIILLERNGSQGDVEITTSTDDSFHDIAKHLHSFRKIVVPGDPERFIHIPTSAEDLFADMPPEVRYSLQEIGVEVSTGPIVDFRVKEYLRDIPSDRTVPLIYPAHFSGQVVTWPRSGINKSNSIIRAESTERWLYPSGFYCVVRRFSSKEEKRRIVASVVAPDDVDGAPMIGFENHLNIFHYHRHGLPEDLARGLALFLNTTLADRHFRRFSGHTQVNATDLRSMKYPSRSILIRMGGWVKRHKEVTQEMIDQHTDECLA